MAIPHAGSGTFTSDFRAEFAEATNALLRRRFLWFAGIVGGLGLIVAGLAIAAAVFGAAGSGYSTLGLTMAAVSTAMYIGAFVAVYFDAVEGRTLLLLTMWVVFMDGVLNLGLRIGNVPGSLGLTGFMISHLIASCFLPWSPRQALQPAIPILVLSALLRLLVEGDTLFSGPKGIVPDLFAIGLSPIAAMPGTAICWARHSRRLDQSKVAFLARRYGEVRRELSDARRIHEALFPPPEQGKSVSYTYRYQPMSAIGGDFLHTCYTPTDDGIDEALNLILLDVTGHGIPAALTVNRLHGEMERIFAENPDTTPGDVLRLLNRYVHLTLARHSVFVTALCIRVDPKHGTIAYASGGHPPAFLRTASGLVERLDSTSFVLGACADRDFDPEPRTLTFAPGDLLVAYTDGATEARNKEGRMLGITGIERMVAATTGPALGAWPPFLLAELDRFRFGPPHDDTLLIEVFRPLTTAAALRDRSQTARHAPGPTRAPASGSPVSP